MKIIIIFVLISLNSQANDLIYKHGFESIVLISGTASGIASTGLVLQLQSETDNSIDDSITINNNGGFAFNQLLEVGENYTISMTTLPNNPSPQSCELSNATGTTPNAGVSNVTITCDSGAWNWNQMNWDEGGWQ